MPGSILLNIVGISDGLMEIIDFEIVKGNSLWRFAMVLLIVLITLVIGRLVQYAVSQHALRIEKKRGVNAIALFLKSLSRPISLAIFACGFFLCKSVLIFGEEGIRATIAGQWAKIAKAIGAIAFAYAMYRLVDVIEYYLNRWAGRTETKLDDMLVPVVRKSLRITIAIVSAIFIVDNILKYDVRSILLSAGVGGIAIALAAKETIANFFGSLTIFADRPFQVGELITVGEHKGFVEEVGFRSTRIRTLQGHLVTIPNSVVANTIVENIGRRPFIRRTSNITITYDSGHTKTKKAVEIIKKVLSQVPEVNVEPEKPPRVYFSDFNDWSLNIYMSYWVKPADYWLYQEVNERINLEIMKRFEAEGIEFAFPSQTLYVKKEQSDND